MTALMVGIFAAAFCGASLGVFFTIVRAPRMEILACSCGIENLVHTNRIHFARCAGCCRSLFTPDGADS